MRKKILTIILMSCVGLSLSAQEKASNILEGLRVSATGGYAVPFETTKMVIFGGNIEVDNAIQTTFGVSYRFMKNWEVAFDVATSKHSLKLVDADLSDLKMHGSEIPYGKVWVTPVGLQVRYCFLPNSQIQPYAGIGGGYVFFNHIDEGWAIQSITYNNVWRVFAEVGASYEVMPHWQVSAFVKKDYSDRSNMLVDFSNTIPQYAIEGQVKWDMLSVGIGVSYEF